MPAKIKNITCFIRSKIGDFTPEIGIILGSGLGQLADKVDVEYTIKYADIPGFPLPTVQGHGGKLIFGLLNGKRVVVMQGRFHYYEGYTPEQTVLPVRVMGMLGIKILVVSNAAGGLNPNFSVGDLMLIRDHINFIPNPLVGPNKDELGPRFPSMNEPYDNVLANTAIEVAKQHDIKLREGCYIALTGPSYETPAEIKYYRLIGGDSIGMSTVPEVIAARHMGLRVLGISVITNMLSSEKTAVATHEEVLEQGQKASEKMITLVEEILKKL